MWKPILAAILASLLSGHTWAFGRWVDLEVHDRLEGRHLQIHPYQGRYYVAGRPGAEYELVLRNRSGERVLAVTSVDGLNVISGESASPGQTGYVLEPYGSVSIKGWRKNMAETAAFYFAEHHDSYAARTDRPFDVGVIGVAVFRERPRPQVYAPERGRYDYGPAGAMDRQEKLGTGHGRREDSYAQYTGFERLSSSPDEILVLRYDTWANLAARGVIPQNPWRDRHEPRPFPQRFAPDPWR